MRGKKKRQAKKTEEEMRKEQPLAGEVDAAAKKGDLARVKQLQQINIGDLSFSVLYFDFQTIQYYKLNAL